MSFSPARISKAIAAAVIATYVWAGEVILSPSAPITAAEWYALAGPLLVALGVYQVANAPAPEPEVESPTVFNAPPLVSGVFDAPVATGPTLPEADILPGAVKVVEG